MYAKKVAQLANDAVTQLIQSFDDPSKADALAAPVASYMEEARQTELKISSTSEGRSTPETQAAAELVTNAFWNAKGIFLAYQSSKLVDLVNGAHAGLSDRLGSNDTQPSRGGRRPKHS
jgi:hypothetical protein